MDKPSTENKQIYISVDLKKYRIRIHKITLGLLGNPKYIQLLINPEKMAIAIYPIEKETSGDQSHKIDYTKSTKDSCDIYSLPFIYKLADIIGNLDWNYSYRFTGNYFASKNVAIFSLKSLSRIET